jgi:hypothetical protein
MLGTISRRVAADTFPSGLASNAVYPILAIEMSLAKSNMGPAPHSTARGVT